jgi:8-oxo-dGTP pyrophosphatase MutT (NUDIX family)
MNIVTEKYAAGILPLCTKTKRFLIAKRSPNIEDPNLWAGFGGKCETGETPVETAIREFYEESGVFVPVKTYHLELEQHKKSKMIYYNFLGLVPYEFSPLVNVITRDNAIEISDFKWLTGDELYTFKDKYHWGFKALLEKYKNVFKNIESCY